MRYHPEFQNMTMDEERELINFTDIATDDQIVENGAVGTRGRGPHGLMPRRVGSV
jgi:hypothetical protein